MVEPADKERPGERSKGSTPRWRSSEGAVICVLIRVLIRVLTADWAGRYRFEGTERWRDCRVIEVFGSCVTVEPLGREANEACEGTVVLELASMGGAEPLELRGEVRHVTRLPGSTVHLGIGFVALSAHAEQLLDLLFALRAAV